jgi:hypothetical protein
MLGELSATIALGACGRRGPQACVTAARALQLNARSVSIAGDVKGRSCLSAGRHGLGVAASSFQARLERLSQRCCVVALHKRRALSLKPGGAFSKEMGATFLSGLRRAMASLEPPRGHSLGKGPRDAGAGQTD